MFEIDYDQEVPNIITDTAKKVSDAFNKKLNTLGITRVQWIALFYLGQDEYFNQNELAMKMKITRSSITRLIDRMEKEGYVKREKELNDRRITRLFLTEKGIKLREILIPEDEKFNRIILQNISSEELNIFKRVLKKMEENTPANYV